MSNTSAEMMDAVFDVAGNTLPPSYPFLLWQTLLCHTPILASEQCVGVLPLRTAISNEGMLLPKRAKLTLRLPVGLTTQVAVLSGLHLDIEGNSLRLGNLKLCPIKAYSTLHAHLVNSDDDEVDFLNSVQEQLTELNINAKLICGMRNQLTSATRTINGFSLVIHDLKPEASLRLQYTGLGADRNLGCGIFIPYKAITDLD